jgi:hypothetical protein
MTLMTPADIGHAAKGEYWQRNNGGLLTSLPRDSGAPAA